MVYVIREGGAYSYKIQESRDGTMRILDEGKGFQSMGDALTYVEKMKKAIATNGIGQTRDPLLRTFGYQIAEQSGNVLSEESGWATLEDINEHIAYIKKAIVEGVKTIL